LVQRILAACSLCALVVGVSASPVQGAVAVVDVASQAGIAETTRTYSAAVADYDGDGFEDALIIRHNPQAPTIPLPRLWTNDGDGTFSDRGGFFSPSDRHGCSWGDANQDGRLDLACGVGLDTNSTNELWIQEADHTLVNRSDEYGVADPLFGGRGRMASFIRADSDIYPELYFNRYASCQEIDGTCVQEDPPKPNRLYRNEALVTGDRIYRDAPEFGLDEAIEAQKDTAGCAQAVDYDKDGDEDLLVCGRYALTLYRNDANSSFTKTGFGTFWKDAELADLNGAGRPDLVEVKNDRVAVRMATSSGFGTAKKWTFAGAGENVGVGDFNGDGRNDVYVVRNCTPETGPDKADVLLINQGGGAFARQDLSPVTEGCGNTVERIDFNHDGSDEFLVLNGRKKRPGPIQLLKSN
jgi:FG-GAP-like repeat